MSLSSLQAIFHSGDLGTKVYELSDSQPSLSASGSHFPLHFETCDSSVEVVSLGEVSSFQKVFGKLEGFEGKRRCSRKTSELRKNEV